MLNEGGADEGAFVGSVTEQEWVIFGPSVGLPHVYEARSHRLDQRDRRLAHAERARRPDHPRSRQEVALLFRCKLCAPVSNRLMKLDFPRSAPVALPFARVEPCANRIDHDR